MMRKVNGSSVRADLPRSLVVVAALATALLPLPAIGQDSLEEIVVAPVQPEARETDVKARSEFTTRNIVAHQYLVVTVDLTRTSVTRVKESLTRGPKKANSATDDIRVRALNAQDEIVAEYSMADPRLIRMQPGSATAQRHEWRVLDTATKKLYIPLDRSIVKVEVIPSPGIDPSGFAGDYFDPRPSAVTACAGQDLDRFPACADFQPGVRGIVTR